MAWHYDKYDDRKSMAERQLATQQARRGLWADAEPVPPWEWWATAKERKAAAR